ncbi:MAG: hypothetical protein NW218_22145 [Saprospiraceae bacterium]|nr:hypothetical protein [Saprospiraceae bacterium]
MKKFIFICCMLLSFKLSAIIEIIDIKNNAGTSAWNGAMDAVDTLKPILKIDTVFTNPYGLVPATIEFGSTSSDTVEWITTMTDTLEIRFPNENWEKIFTYRWTTADDIPKIYSWEKSHKSFYSINLLYKYLSGYPNSLSYFLNGTSFDIRFSVSNINKINNTNITVYSNIVHVQVPPATSEDRLSFIALHDNLGAFRDLISIIDSPNDINSTYKSKLVEFASTYPNSIIGKMAKLNLARFACVIAGGVSRSITDANVRTYIHQIYDELKASPILFLQENADRFLKVCLD